MLPKGRWGLRFRVGLCQMGPGLPVTMSWAQNIHRRLHATSIGTKNIRILQTMVSGIPLILGLGIRMWDPYVGPLASISDFRSTSSRTAKYRWPSRCLAQTLGLNLRKEKRMPTLGPKALCIHIHVNIEKKYIHIEKCMYIHICIYVYIYVCIFI